MDFSMLTFKSISCICTYSPQLDFFDSGGKIVNEYVQECPVYDVSYLNYIRLTDHSPDQGESTIIVIEPVRFFYRTLNLSNETEFAEKFSTLFGRFIGIAGKIPIKSVAVRVHYEVQIANDGKFMPLKESFDLPGLEDERLDGLVHYHVSLIEAPYRTIITIGQSRRRELIFLTPDFECRFEGQVGNDQISEKIVALRDQGLKTFQSFMREKKV